MMHGDFAPGGQSDVEPVFPPEADPPPAEYRLFCPKIADVRSALHEKFAPFLGD
jgi:hypothetical protein